MNNPLATAYKLLAGLLTDNQLDFRQPDGTTARQKLAEIKAAVNHYDRADMVRQERLLLAGPLKVAVYRVRDPETGEFSSRQFHMTYNNTVLALMSEEAAKLFTRIVRETLEPNPEGSQQ